MQTLEPDPVSTGVGSRIFSVPSPIRRARAFPFQRRKDHQCHRTSPPPRKTALVAAPELRPLIGGAWLLGGTLGGLLIRKPGAALFCEIVAAFISVLFDGGAWSGEILLAGLIQGIGAEIAFAIFGYRRWNATIAIFAGALCGLFMGGNEIFIYYPDMEPVKAIIYVASSVISGAVIAGFLAWILVKNLAKTGVLSSLASGNTRR